MKLKMKQMSENLSKGLTKEFIEKYVSFLQKNFESFKHNRALFGAINMDESMLVNESFVV